MIWRDSITKACVFAAVIAGTSSPVLGGGKLLAVFCAQPDTEKAQLVVVAPSPTGRVVYPGGHKAIENLSSLAWSDGEDTVVLQVDRLVTVGPGGISTLPCVDVTLLVNLAATEVIAASPDLQNTLQTEDFLRALSALQATNDALTLQLDTANQTFTPTPDAVRSLLKSEPLCEAILGKWGGGQAKALIDIFGAKTSEYVQACRG